MAERESIPLAIDVGAPQTEAVKVDFIDFIDLEANNATVLLTSIAALAQIFSQDPS